MALFLFLNEREHFFKLFFGFFLAALGLSCSMQDLVLAAVAANSLQTLAPCIGNTES